MSTCSGRSFFKGAWLSITLRYPVKTYPWVQPTNTYYFYCCIPRAYHPLRPPPNTVFVPVSILRNALYRYMVADMSYRVPGTLYAILEHIPGQSGRQPFAQRQNAYVSPLFYPRRAGQQVELSNRCMLPILQPPNTTRFDTYSRESRVPGMVSWILLRSIYYTPVESTPEQEILLTPMSCFPAKLPTLLTVKQTLGINIYSGVSIIQTFVLLLF